ncbi:hypothetical protein GCM10023197_25630 [Gordonia humi]|uniref:Putative CocE/NonD family hydrolase n=1 Tax=Gordonia humi TaxID=686429 RepID=A0A840F5V8_9ACTN|nr:putative CocE/NonD family hydrolase [Gordonia humi]
MVRLELDVQVAMRDGTKLSTDIWIPDDAPAPVLLVRTPYGKHTVPVLGHPLLPSFFAALEAGYALVWQDCRGTFGSSGIFTPMVDEPSDGTDAVEWIREQPWCNGTVGTFGPSYLGFTQWATASQRPPGSTPWCRW